MQRVRDQIDTLARLPWHVRIEGPSGSGKNLAARRLHQLSARAAGPFGVCSLAMLPDGMELAEMVGHRRGAFTGAVEDRAGAFERAHTGTLFLNELATASGQAQQALLQLVDEGSFHRLGKERVRVVDIRIVFATNEDLEDRVAQGRFREDLYHRLGLLVLRMPALAEHAEDIPELAEHSLGEKCRQAGVSVAPLSTHELQGLMAYSWPGNVRQLDRVMEHYVAFGRLPDMVNRAARLPDWRSRVADVLRECAGNKSAAARELGIS
ncbi:MAG: sigma-54-dependent transcriptional regulator, partial [Gemmatimonadales bacterium]